MNEILKLESQLANKILRLKNKKKVGKIDE